jgi:hypothetical protein
MWLLIDRNSARYSRNTVRGRSGFLGQLRADSASREAGEKREKDVEEIKMGLGRRAIDALQGPTTLASSQRYSSLMNVWMLLLKRIDP